MNVLLFWVVHFTWIQFKALYLSATEWCYHELLSEWLHLARRSLSSSLEPWDERGESTNVQNSNCVVSRIPVRVPVHLPLLLNATVSSRQYGEERCNVVRWQAEQQGPEPFVEPLPGHWITHREIGKIGSVKNNLQHGWNHCRMEAVLTELEDKEIQGRYFNLMNTTSITF